MEIHIYSPSIKQKAPFGYNRDNNNRAKRSSVQHEEVLNE